MIRSKDMVFLNGVNNLLYYLADGSKYVGEWADGKQNGTGTICDMNGLKKKGQWVDGKVS